MKYYYLYKITNIVNNKIYIGVHETSNLEDGYMGSGKYLWNAVSKHGIHNFKKEIMEFFSTPEEMYNKELEIVNEEFLKRKDVYNLTLGGDGSWYRANSTGKNLYGKNGQPGYGGENLLPRHEQIKVQKERGTYESINESISLTLKEKHMSGELVSAWITDNPMYVPEFKEKQISKFKEIQHQRGSKNSQYGTIWITNKVTGDHAKVSNHEPMPNGWIKGRKKLKLFEENQKRIFQET